MLSNCTKHVYNAGNRLKLYQELFKHINNITCQRNIFGNSQIGSRRKVYEERKLIGFSMEQMYSVVSDVENYNKFLPFCKKSQIIRETAGFLKANLVIGFPPIVESYSSNVTLVRPRMVKAVCTDGKLFYNLETIWKFSPALKNNIQSCIVDFHISFEFRSALYSNIVHLLFDTLARQMEVAIITEVKARYGKESVPTQRLEIINNRT